MADEQRVEKVLQAAQGLDIPVFVIGQADGCIPIAQLLNSEEIEQGGTSYPQAINTFPLNVFINFYRRKFRN